MPCVFRRQAFAVTALLLGTFATIAPAADFDMTGRWDARIALENPYKGWYHHWPDNGWKKYVIADDRDLTDFPGMDHLYMRLAWSYLEPREGEFHWELLDRQIKKWTGKGLGIAFRISCRETGTDPVEQQFATPKWVMEAGAQGGYYYKGEVRGPDGPWEPVFDDPIFLAKLENFLRAFGARYDGRPWLRYVDVGSVGDWGEGHTSSGSHKVYDFKQRKPHVDLYRRYFPTTRLVISDDFVYGCPEDQRDAMHRHVLAQDITYRDDSILVDGYVRRNQDTFCVRSPEYFADSWRLGPNVFELQHYGAVRRDGNWLGRPGSSVAEYGQGKTGADYFRGAMRLLHATYIGYHGDARQWLDENPELTVELLNRSGYWYFLHCVRTPDVLTPGREQTVRITWENRGVAPAYHAYDLVFRLEGPASVDLVMPSGNCQWFPDADDGNGGPTAVDYTIAVPKRLSPGTYRLKLKLHSSEAARDVRLALADEIMDAAGFYEVGTVDVGL